MTQKADVEEFISQKRLAVAGVSRKSNKFGNAVFKELKKKGYQVWPVNPNMETFQGEPCYPDLKSVPGPIDGVVVVLPPKRTEVLVKEAKEAGINRVWMQLGAQSDAAVDFCKQNGMLVVANECILMFAEPVASFHKFHRWIWKVFGKLPN